MGSCECSRGSPDCLSAPFCCERAGKVKEGLDVIKKVEAVGSQGGETSKPVTVVDCGELPLGA